MTKDQAVRQIVAGARRLAFDVETPDDAAAVVREQFKPALATLEREAEIQRARGLVIGNRLRVAAARLRVELAECETRSEARGVFADLLRQSAAGGDSEQVRAFGGLRVLAVLTWLPGVGKAEAAGLARRAGARVASVHGLRVRELTAREALALADAVASGRNYIERKAA